MSCELIHAEEVEVPASRFIRLNTIDEIHSEMRKVYRDMRTKKLPMQDGSRLVFVLSQMARVAEVIRVERRLDEFQERLENAGIKDVSNPIT